MFAENELADINERESENEKESSFKHDNMFRIISSIHMLFKSSPSDGQ